MILRSGGDFTIRKIANCRPMAEIYFEESTIKLESTTSSSEDDDEVVAQDDDPKDTNEKGFHDLPAKSKQKYEATYKKFMEWKVQKGYTDFTSHVLLTYFKEMSEKFKATSLWATYSMLRSVILTKHNVNIHDFSPLLEFLKTNSKGYVPKKAEILEPEHIRRFLTDAPDDKYLVVKVALVIGIIGACRREELTNLTINDVEDHDTMLFIKIEKTNSQIQRTFTITSEFYLMCKKYMKLRPENPCTTRFFLNYHNGACTRQPIGINKFGSMPKEIAKFLCLPNPELYTGHAFRRTSAVLLNEAGTGITTRELSRFGCFSPRLEYLLQRAEPDKQGSDSGKNSKHLNQETISRLDQQNLKRMRTFPSPATLLANKIPRLQKSSLKNTHDASNKVQETSKKSYDGDPPSWFTKAMDEMKGLITETRREFNARIDHLQNCVDALLPNNMEGQHEIVMPESKFDPLEINLPDTDLEFS
ncbi:hypothetical protein TKK_0009020 [Trichogramma kaykai]